MSSPQPPKPVVPYLLWLALMGWTMTLHWIYPLIVFALGSVILHNSGFGGPLRALVRRVQAQRGVDTRRAQQLLGAAGAILVLVATPMVMASRHHLEEQQAEATRIELEASMQREAEARAVQAAAEARRAAAAAEAQRLKAQQEKEAAEARQRQQEAEDRQREADRQQAQEDQAERDRQQQLKDDQQAEQERQEADQKRQQAERERQQAEVDRRAAEGPYTQEQATDMCWAETARQLGVQQNAMVEHGNYVEVMDSTPRSLPFGEGHLWFWRPVLKVVGYSDIVRTVCRVYEDGRVEVGDAYSGEPLM